MRITGGFLRGRVIETRDKLGYRPVSSVVRQAVFDVLFSERIELKSVIDVCCGSGIVGIEALSRGARDVLFLDDSREIVDLLRLNLERLDVSGKVICTDIGWLFRQEELFADLIYFDPPYNNLSLLENFMESVSKIDFQVLVVETHRDTTLPLLSELYIDKIKQYGKSKLSFIRRLRKG